MKKLIAVDDETGEEVILAKDDELSKFYCLLEDVEFYYNDLLSETQDVNQLNAYREELQTKVESFLFKQQ
jgi:hypothetical protein